MDLLRMKTTDIFGQCGKYYIHGWVDFDLD